MEIWEITVYFCIHLLYTKVDTISNTSHRGTKARRSQRGNHRPSFLIFSLFFKTNNAKRAFSSYIGYALFIYAPSVQRTVSAGSCTFLYEAGILLTEVFVL
jgi:hypothetical protein